MFKLLVSLLCGFQMIFGMQQPKLEGTYAATLMPLKADLSCDCHTLASHCRDLISKGCQGIVLFGTTGEGPSFSQEEKLSILESLLTSGLPAKKILVANGSTGFSETVVLAKAALKQGCPAMLIAPPSYYKNVSEEGVIAYYREIIQEVSDPNLRILLYHIPQLTGVPITLPIIKALTKEFPKIVIGMKESEGNLALTKASLKMFPSFQVFVGYENQIIEAVRSGASGSICGLANLYPELICSLYTMGKQRLSTNPPQVGQIFDAFKSVSFIPAAKAFLERQKGPIWHTLRPPLVPLNDVQKREFYSKLPP